MDPLLKFSAPEEASKGSSLNLWTIAQGLQNGCIILLFIVLYISSVPIYAQQISSASKEISRVWVPDLGNGKYKNPIIFADYSDPDVCRAGSDYYLVASSFDAVPGLPVLHSNDLVNWTIIGHALLRQPPYKHYSKTQHGGGVWAPSIRYHHDAFYIYYPDVSYGIYMVKAGNPAGPWSSPVLVEKGIGLEDPCPLWIGGQAYLIHAFAGSRAGIRDILVLHKMNKEGTKVIDKGVIVYDGHGVDPDIEGPKLYKRHGYYYIFAPAGGFSSDGYQVVLRSKNIYGPYDRKVVMHAGNTNFNGAHQGGWVTTPDGKQSWFIHFRDMGAYGRVTYLEPMKWINNWPIIGLDEHGIGVPVTTYQKPDVGKTYPVATPQTSDEFNTNQLGLQWQWQANPKATWYFMTNQGSLRLYAQLLPADYKNYWDVPNMLMQKFPAEKFIATTKLTFHPLQEGDKVGLIIMGMNYAYVSLTKQINHIQLDYTTCIHADKGDVEKEIKVVDLQDSTIYLRVTVDSGAVCHFSYSMDGKRFTNAGKSFTAVPGKWIGAKLGLFCTSTRKSNDAGYADFDWFRIEPVEDN